MNRVTKIQINTHENDQWYQMVFEGIETEEVLSEIDLSRYEDNKLSWCALEVYSEDVPNSSIDTYVYRKYEGCYDVAYLLTDCLLNERLSGHIVRLNIFSYGYYGTMSECTFEGIRHIPGSSEDDFYAERCVVNGLSSTPTEKYPYVCFSFMDIQGDMLTSEIVITHGCFGDVEVDLEMSDYVFEFGNRQYNKAALRGSIRIGDKTVSGIFTPRCFRKINDDGVYSDIVRLNLLPMSVLACTEGSDNRNAIMYQYNFLVDYIRDRVIPNLEDTMFIKEDYYTDLKDSIWEGCEDKKHFYEEMRDYIFDYLQLYDESKYVEFVDNSHLNDKDILSKQVLKTEVRINEDTTIDERSMISMAERLLIFEYL